LPSNLCQNGRKRTKFANECTETADCESPKSSRLLFTRGYSVFNAAQVDGYTPKPDRETPMPEPIGHADTFFGRIGANVRHGGNQAFYAPAPDDIQMPQFQAFRERLSYYSTLANAGVPTLSEAAICYDRWSLNR
jgi:antirestriction protein ArdC